MSLPHVKPKLWTKAEFRRMLELGLIRDGDRVELILGEIVPMAAHNPPHSQAIMRGTEVLLARFGQTHYVRCRLPFDAPDDTEPEPDFLLVSRSAHVDYRKVHPGVADLIIEVSDSSLAYDRDVKSHLYAFAKVPEYWIVNLVDHCIEVARDPQPQAGALLGHAYQATQTWRRPQAVAPLFAPHQAIGVGDLLGDP